MGSRVHGDIQLKRTAKVILIRGQCTPHVTQVGIQIVAVTVSNMAPAIRDDVGVKYAVAVQQIHRMMEVK